VGTRTFFETTVILHFKHSRSTLRYHCTSEYHVRVGGIKACLDTKCLGINADLKDLYVQMTSQLPTTRPLLREVYDRLLQLHGTTVFGKAKIDFKFIPCPDDEVDAEEEAAEEAAEAPFLIDGALVSKRGYFDFLDSSEGRAALAEYRAERIGDCDGSRCRFRI